MADDDLDAFRIKWANESQRTSYLALGRLLTRAERAGLPPLRWTILTTRVIRGKIPWTDLTGERHTRESAMALYERWKEFLGAVDDGSDEHFMTLSTVTYAARSKGLAYLAEHEVLLEVEVERP